MEKTLIVNARVGNLCEGPDFGIYVGEVELMPESGESIFFSIMETGGCAITFRTDHPVFEMLTGPDDFAEALEELEANNLLYVSDSYGELLKELEHIECHDGIRYLVYIIRASRDEVDTYIAKTKGKNLEEIVIPPPNIGREPPIAR